MFNQFHQILKNLSHHCYLIEGSVDEVLPPLLSFLGKEHSVSNRGNPDFWQSHFEVFRVEDGRALREMQARTSVSGGKRFFVFSFISITEEAQNSLLKILEEPTGKSHFFIITPTISKLFPTVLSRAAIVSRNHVSDSCGAHDSLVEIFLASKPAERLARSRHIIEEKNKNEVALFLNALERKLFSQFEPRAADEKARERFKKIALARRDLMTGTSSIKLILENLALTL